MIRGVKVVGKSYVYFGYIVVFEEEGFVGEVELGEFCGGGEGGGIGDGEVYVGGGDGVFGGGLDF